VGSPIRQNPAILKEFLDSLQRLSQESYTLDYYFVDDNVVEKSHQLLQEFAQQVGSSCRIEKAQWDDPNAKYERTPTFHIWNEGSMWKVAAFKDKIIDCALHEGYDYLFLIDSDLVLHPKNNRPVTLCKCRHCCEYFLDRFLLLWSIFALRLAL